MTKAAHMNNETALTAELEALFTRTNRDIPADLTDSYSSFVHGLWHNVTVEDVVSEPTARQNSRTLGLWQWGSQRQAGETHLRVYNPPELGTSWRDEVTYIELVMEDMPFIVDSLTAELARLNINVRMMLHPVMNVMRNEAGALVKLQSAKAEGFTRESWMHISIERQASEGLDAIKTMLLKVLADVRLAVTDWPDMRTAVRAAISAVPTSLPKGIRPEAVLETQRFLEWLDSDHFVFLGYRDYTLSSDGARLESDPAAARGLLRDSDLIVLRGLRKFDELPEAVQTFLKSPEIVFVNKAQARSSVHRAVAYDLVGIKRFDSEGRFNGLRIFLGLHTSTAYSRNSQDIPWLRLKVSQVIERSQLDPRGHSGKALVHILNTYPRDDLFQMDTEQLHEISRGILLLAERLRTALFIWRDPFNRFVSCLVYTPREHFDTSLRRRFIHLLEQGWNGKASSFSTGFTDSPLVRLQVTIDLENTSITPDLAALERKLIDAARGWDDRFIDSTMALHGHERGVELRTRYGHAFPQIYRSSVLPERAASDLTLLESVQGARPIALTLHAVDGKPNALQLRLFHRDTPLALSDVLPRLENMGLRVISEVPYAITPRSGANCWISELLAETRDGAEIDLARVEKVFIEAFYRQWDGELEDDRFNQLTLRLGLNWREVSMLRAYAKYLQQARFHPTPSFIRDTLSVHLATTQNFVQLFHAKFDPAAHNPELAAELAETIRKDLEKVTSLAEDEVLRRYLNLLECTLRTNYYQMAADGTPKPYISFKLDSQQLLNLPKPRPLVEMWVYSTRIEGVHLRGGRVARGGIRWSDRRDDFRTEVLGLMKAQQVKNAVIVPVGSKGGFYCKQLPTDRAAEGKEVIACYQTYIRGLLDITDNRVGDSIMPPRDVVRHDQDDPYLVVAADKGTAKFSDIANALSLEYGFWLGDGFASGGSVGYDHKHMGITARGAWEAVKRHFRELGKDVQNEDFTCVGVGDMAGDVFGNGMLRSQHTLLVAAFNHKHIFLDPNPDTATSYAERARLFALPTSQWSDYDAGKISKGGGVYERAAKSITLSNEVRARFGITEEKIAPSELIRALLKARVELLYLGGIGTYLKASTETHEEVNDRANDALRIDAAELGTAVVGEGANLGVTARARIEAAKAGIRINSDAIDNSAGVDTSDHEVNIKIALQPEMAQMTLTKAARDELLASMTDEVAGLVLRDNYLQTQLITLELRQAPQLLDAHARLIETLEKAGRLDRKVEYLPSQDQISQRAIAGEGMTRPELALLLAYAKMALSDALVRSDLPDNPVVEADLLSYFPQAMQSKFVSALKGHRLRREIIATVLANEVVNRLGITFVQTVAERSGHGPAEVVRAWIAVRAALDLQGFWQQVEVLDNKVPAETQLELLEASMRFAARAVGAVLANNPQPLDVAQAATALSAQLKGMSGNLTTLLPEEGNRQLAQAALKWTSAGVPNTLAHMAAQFTPLAAGPDILQIAGTAGVTADEAAQVYYAVGNRFKLDGLRQSAENAKAKNYWQRQMALSLIDTLFNDQLKIAANILSSKQNLDSFAESKAESVARIDQLMNEVQNARSFDLAMLAMVSSALRNLA